MKLCPQCESGYADGHVTCPTHGVMLSEIRDLRPGMLIRNTYRIVRKLGQGGMGAVYLAEHTLMGEGQALKFLSSELSQDEAFTSRFLDEVRTLRQVRHRNVVDAGNLELAEDGTLFFSMEFVDGPDLLDFLDAAPKPFDVKLALEITRGIAEGLGAAHAQGMVHRDIKPENILMARVGERWIPKIADFGIVATKESSRRHTKTGGTLLTMAYAAPEQWRGMKAAELDGRTDLYALGGVLYEMLTGRNVFDAEGYEGWAEQHKNASILPPSSLRPELANWAGLDALVLRLLAKEREKRPGDAAELLRLLDAVWYAPPATRQVTEPEPYQARTRVDTRLSGQNAGKRPWVQRVPVRVWTTLAGVLLGATIIVWTVFGPHPATQQDATGVTEHEVQPEPGQSKPETHADARPINPKPAETPKSAPLAARNDEDGSTWTDPATGLVWAKKDNGSDVDWQQATDYCRNLRLGAHGDWRLPTINELQRIYDKSVSIPGQCCGGQSVNWHVKGNLQLSGLHWSSSRGTASGEAWAFGFILGYRLSDPTGFSTRRALCVRRSGE